MAAWHRGTVRYQRGMKKWVAIYHPTPYTDRAVGRYDTQDDASAAIRTYIAAQPKPKGWTAPR